jgi:hypothetical protein
MADTRVTPLVVIAAGLTTSYTAGIIVGTTDFVVRNNGNMKIHVKKSGAGSCNMIVKTPNQIASLDIADLTVVIPATTGDVMAGPFPKNVYNDGNGDLRFNFSEVTGLTFMAFEG